MASELSSLEPECGLSKDVTLVFNGKQEVIADRESLGRSCFYFNRLLYGPFAESKQDRITMHFDNEVPFECFEHIIKYAETGVFVRLPRDKIDIYYPMIQQASLWQYDSLVETIEHYLATEIDDTNIIDIHTLAARMNYKHLLNQCKKFEMEMNCLGTRLRKPPVCPLRNHDHPYYFCAEKMAEPSAWLTEKERIRKFWDTNYSSLSEEQKELLAEGREYQRFFRNTVVRSGKQF